MLTKLVRALSIGLLLSCYSVLAKAESAQIHLLQVSFPPLWIVDGPLKGQGMADRAEHFFQQQLTEFNFKTLPVTVSRAEKLMTDATGATYCAVPHGKDFFENVVESQVWSAISGHVLVTHKELANQLVRDDSILNAAGQLKLQSFLRRYPDLQGFVAKSQRYPIVDTYIQPYRGQRIRELVPEDMLSLAEMVEIRRGDFTFQYESSVRYLQLIGKEVGYLTLDELNPHWVEIVVGCNDTALARRFVNQVNRNIDALRQVGLKSMQQYLSPFTYLRLKPYVDAGPDLVPDKF